MKITTLEKLIRKYLLFAALLILAIIKFDRLMDFGHVLWFAFSNIVFAAMLAYVVNIIMVRVERLLSLAKDNRFIKKTKRPLSLLISLAFIVLILYALFALVFPALREAVDILLQSLPVYFDELQTFFLSIFKDNEGIAKAIEGLEIDWRNLLEKTVQMLGNGLGNVLGTTFNVITMVVGSIFNILLINIFSIYILLEKERFVRLYERLARLYMKPAEKEKVDVTLKIIHQSFSSFIGGQCVEAVILGTLCALGMFLLRMPYAVMVGTLVGVINIIPIVGAYVGGAIGMFMVFTQDPLMSIGFLFYLIILQQFESNVIYPRVVGNSVGLPGVYVLGSVMVFGSLAGIPGMFLGIPTVASIYKISRLYVERQEKRVKKANNALTKS